MRITAAVKTLTLTTYLAHRTNNRTTTNRIEGMMVEAIMRVVNELHRS